MFDELAHEAVAVRMHARRLEPDQDVADGEIGTRQNFIAFDRANREPRKIVITTFVQARHLGGLSADQRATRIPAAIRDASDNLARHPDVELPDREVIEKEQRLRALHDEIVDAHGDEIDADRRMPPCIDGDLELRTDAVVRRDKYRIAVTCPLQIEEATETAEINVGAGPARRFRERLDGSNQRISRVDINARVGIGDGSLRFFVSRGH